MTAMTYVTAQLKRSYTKPPPHLLLVQAEQPVGGEARPADVAAKLPLGAVLVEDVALVAGALALVLEVAVARGVGAVAVAAAEAVGELLVAVAVDVALQQGPRAERKIFWCIVNVCSFLW